MCDKKSIIFTFPEEYKEDTLNGMIKLRKNEGVSKFSVTLNEIKDWFTAFDIKEIELSVSGGITSGQITQLFISGKGEGGMKVILIPKE